MNLETAIRFAAKGDAVLFLGAGFSFGVHSIQNAVISSGRQLAEKIATLAGLPLDTPLTLAAEIFRDQKGTDELIGIIKPAFTAAMPVPKTHSIIATLPWRRIYTTNYDDVFEKASESNGKPAFSVTLSDRVQDIPKADCCCVHLNGFVGKLDRTSIDSEIKLTDSSYLQNAIHDSEWATLLSSGCQSSLFALFVVLSGLETQLQLPIRSRSAIHARLIVVSARNRRASATLCLSPLRRRVHVKKCKKCGLKHYLTSATLCLSPLRRRVHVKKCKK